MKTKQAMTWSTFPIVSALVLFCILCVIYAPSYYFSPKDRITELFVAGIVALFIIRFVVAKVRKETSIDYIYYLTLLYTSPFIAKAIREIKYPNY